MKKLNLFTFLALSLLFLNPKALALSEVRFPEIPSKNEPVSFSLQLEHFQTHANWRKEAGKFSELDNQSSFQYIAYHPSFSYSPFPLYLNFELFANIFYASSKTGKAPPNFVLFRPTVLGAGVSSYHKIKTMYAGLELRGGIPLYGHLFGSFQNANEILLGDGSYFVEPGAWLIFKPSEMFYIYMNTAFRYRFSSLSSLLFARLGGALTMQNIDAGVSVDPFFSVLSDQLSSQPGTRHNLLRANAGSLKFYSVNPSSYLAWTLWMEFKYRPAFIKLYFHLDTFGQNYAKGLNLGLIAKFKWNTKQSIIHKQHNTKFDFDEKDFESSRPEKDSYFDEEEDPYNEKKLNKELKKELDSLRY